MRGGGVKWWSGEGGDVGAEKRGVGSDASG